MPEGEAHDSAPERRPLVAANWKMNKTVAEADEFLERFIGSIGELATVDVVVCPPYTGARGDRRAHPPLAGAGRGTERP